MIPLLCSLLYFISHSYSLSATHTVSFPMSVMETSEDEIKEYVSPYHLGIGNTINVLGRRFFMWVTAIILSRIPCRNTPSLSCMYTYTCTRTFHVMLHDPVMIVTALPAATTSKSWEWNWLSPSLSLSPLRSPNRRYDTQHLLICSSLILTIITLNFKLTKGQNCLKILVMLLLCYS